MKKMTLALTLIIGGKTDWYSHPDTSIQARNPFVVDSEAGQVTILMRGGHYVVVDLADFPRVSGIHWTGDGGYAQGTIRVGGDQERVRLHRYLFGREAQGWFVDHVDGRRWCSVRSNLRLATPTQNCLNRGPNASNPHGFKGVRLNKSTGRYFTQIKSGGKQHRVGSFATPAEAAREYDRWARRLFGEFARTNFPEEIG